MKMHEFMSEMRSTSNILGRHGVSVVFEGTEAATDGNTIYLPALPLDATLSPKMVRLMRGYVDHEAGHVRHSDMNYVQDFGDRCQKNGKDDLFFLGNCLEDVWMERKVISEYVGAEKNLSECNKEVSQKSRDFYDASGRSFDIKDIPDVAWHLKTMGTKDYTGGEASRFVEEIPEEYRPLMEKFNEENLKCKTTQDAVKLATAIYDLLKEKSEDELKEMNPEDFELGDGDPLEEIGENSKDFKKGEGEGKGKKGDKKADGLDGLQESTEQAIADETSKGGGIGGEGESLGGSYAVSSTEKDVEYHRGKKSKGYQPVQDIVDSTDYSQYQKVRAKVANNISMMSSKLKRAILASKNRDWDRFRENGKLDTKSLVRAYQRKPDVYKVRKDRQEHDTVITLLVDLSGSMYGDKATVATECLVAVSECLTGAGITFNVVGFSNRGSAGGVGSRLSHHRIERKDTVFFKDFNTPLRTSRASIAQVAECIGGNNTDYDFICDAINALEKRPEKRKILLTFSDGHPASAGRGSAEELCGFCRQAVKDGERKGIESIGIGIQDDSVKRIYPKYTVVQNINDLSGSVFKQLTNLLVKEIKRS